MATTRRTTNIATPCNRLVTCMDCEHAILHRYGSNPILAACKCQPQHNNERFPFLVEVASFQRRCANYRHSLTEKQVEIRVRPAAA
jgi:hypothetical protein